MKNLMKFLLPALAVMLFISCSNDNDNDYQGATNYSYATLGVDGEEYFFIGDSGKKYFPSDKSELSSDYEITYKDEDDVEQSKEGDRVLIYYSFLDTAVEGYDQGIKVFAIFDILSKEVEVANDATELAVFGDDNISLANMYLSGDWIDVGFYVMTASDMNHKISLVDNKIATTPEDMPSGYTYLELLHSAEDGTGVSVGSGNVSFKLSDAYHPKVTGSEGLYIGYTDLQSNTKEYIKIEYTE